MTDKKFEELLKEAVEQCVEKEWEEISQKSKKIRYKPSKEFEEKMEKLYQKESCQNNFIGDEQYKRLMAYMKALQKLEQMERIVED